MENSTKFGKIKVYGKTIDLDNISNENLEKVYSLIKERTVSLGVQYIESDLGDGLGK